jgi:hypothetical protein
MIRGFGMDEFDIDVKEFDIFAIQIFLRNVTMDELVIGYFFGKKNESLEYLFYIFPSTLKRKLPKFEHMTHFEFKEKISEIFNDFFPDNPEIIANSKKIMDYVHFQFKKIGGSEVFSKRLSYLIEKNEKDEVNMELLGLFDNWVEKKEIQVNIETFTVEEFSKIIRDSLDIDNLSDNYKNFSELRNMPEFYPLIDPINGVTIDRFEVGMPLKCTVFSYPDKKMEERVMEHYKDHIDRKEGFLKPIDGVIISKELLPGKKETYILVKLRLLDDVSAYSIILKALRLVKPDPMLGNLLPPPDKKQDPIPNGTEKSNGTINKKETKAMETLKEKARFKFADFLLILLIVGGSIVSIALVMDLLNKK